MYFLFLIPKVQRSASELLSKISKTATKPVFFTMLCQTLSSDLEKLKLLIKEAGRFSSADSTK